MKFLDAMDAFSSRIFRPFTKVFCYLTGRNSFTFARLALIAGLIQWWLDELSEYAHHPDGWGVFILLVIMPWWSWVGRRRFRFYKELERAFENSTGTLNVNLRELTSFVWDRRFLNVLMLIGLPFLPGDMSEAGFTLFVASHFIVLHGHPGGKSVVKRAVEAGKKAAAAIADKARDLAPIPSPIPVPIGA